MKLVDVQSLVGRVAAIDADCAEWGVLQTAVGDLRRLKSWVEGREVAFARSIAKVSSYPEKSLAEAGCTTLRQAEQVLHRADTAYAVPEFGTSLDAGRVSGEHVDVLTRTLGQLEPAVRAKLIENAPSLLPIAEHVAADEFARAVRAEARRLEREGDGLERLERQRRAIRFNTWIDKQTGMGRWSATWDPETMLRLEARIDAQVEVLFHDAQPAGCPSDLIEKQSYLRAHAMLALLDGKGVRLGKPELIVVEDHTDLQPDGQPTIDYGLDVDLPRSVVDELRRTANVYTITVRNGVVLRAPGVLNLGRTTRLANRAQRRALQALYATCAIPDCRVRYSRTKLHHVVWWQHDGCSDLDNFLPVCELHHQKIHNGGWAVSLGPNRQLTIKFPDGSIMTTGPPMRGAS